MKTFLGGFVHEVPRGIVQMIRPPHGDMQRPASQISSINVMRHTQAAAHCWTGMSHLPCSQPHRADADSAQSCTTDMVDSVAAQGSSLVSSYATILKMLKAVTSSALLHWHHA
ncbi:hypothetical protein [Stenotrophomonas maltophilia]|uniref:hypothetical protein n=1 Tax=Stenotrophomonas maltophilia TaxID=40324 RepID=UPI00137894E6|nr:hypothetical protein [Stenotrophomonas maltophilia]ELK2664981.1 hypothetical protein [Stenotrophomonas maltophilia]MBH1375357.1 hypothetical protein [Stenotrophomonas maltophilia]MBH1438502.1 hypothetical protein [Stenotrophomonas maltophilia]MBH1559998.1 hypothetical protein [Stenotrophomonas maltophilia]MBN4986895.1 hypothetical protein [Stenotrophomonas maltophilia]